MRLPQLSLVYFSLALSAGIFLFSCSSDPETKNDLVSKYNGILPALVQNDSNLFHGIALGMNKTEVKNLSLKTDSLGMEEADYLLFEGRLGPGQEYTYDCLFDDKGLLDLTLDIHLKKEKNAHVLFTDFRNYFTQKYGPPIDSVDIWSWNVKDSKRPAIVDLQEEDGYGYGKLLITMYDRTFEPDTLDGEGMFDDSLILP